jgi:hypothetical protein
MTEAYDHKDGYMGRITLPNIRSQPVAFEDCVSALFNAGGYHVERHIRHRDLEEVLELDAVATDYSTSPPTRVLVESKSGAWGYPDLFKVLGWMKYLGFERGVVTVATVPKEKSIETINARLKSTWSASCTPRRRWKPQRTVRGRRAFANS